MYLAWAPIGVFQSNVYTSQAGFLAREDCVFHTGTPLCEIDMRLVNDAAIQDCQLHDSILNNVEDERTPQNGGGGNEKGKCVDPMFRPHSQDR